MPEAIHPHSVLEIAIRLEQQGADFYRRAAELPHAAEAREMLLSLARMEDDHQAQFRAMQLSLGGNATPAADASWATGYLQTFGGGILFNDDPAARLGTDTPLDEILRLAIAGERDSIALYVGLREIIPDQDGQDRVMTIIREEMAHATQLSDQLVRLMREKS